MKLGKLASPKFNAAFTNLMQTKGVNGKTAFKFRGIAKKIQEELQKYEEQKTAYINEFADRNEDGTIKVEVVHGTSIIKFLPGKLNEYNKKMGELNEVEIEIPTVKVEELPDFANFTLEDIYQLEFIVE
jgi:nitrogen regulatory protein PII-like uncharacterized protein